MALKVTAVAISEVTRFVSDGPTGLIAADVTIDFEDGDTGVAPRITISVDLPDAEALSFSEIETRSLADALSVIATAAQLNASELERAYREKFIEQKDESPAG